MASATPSTVDAVAIIGAGASGLAAARYLQCEAAFSTIAVFEQRGAVGGLWNATPDMSGTLKVLDGRPAAAPVSWRDGEAPFASPVYDDLETNLPHSLMRFSDLAFPDGTPLLPRHHVVREYLERYADAADVRRLVRLGVKVLIVQPVADGRGRWAVTVRDLRTRDEPTIVFDAVVVASGHFDSPFVPDVPGICEWQAAYPEAISHSMSYRRPGPYRDKKVIVVGNSASGVDIAAQIASVSRHLLLSERDAAARLAPIDDIPVVEPVPEIAQFVVQDRAVRFADGRVEQHVDHVVFCTGYCYDFPFLRSLDPPATAPKGTRVQNVYQHIFYAPRPTLAFVGLPLHIVPFPAAEGQAAVIARVLSRRLRLPSAQEMRDWEAGEVAQRGAGKSFHRLGFPRDAEYLNFLHAWSAQAARGPGGKVPPSWGAEEKWVRSQVHSIRAAARKLGRQRSAVYTLAHLGLDWEGGRRGAEAAAEETSKQPVL